MLLYIRTSDVNANFGLQNLNHEVVHLIIADIFAFKAGRNARSITAVQGGTTITLISIRLFYASFYFWAFRFDHSGRCPSLFQPRFSCAHPFRHRTETRCSLERNRTTTGFRTFRPLRQCSRLPRLTIVKDQPERPSSVPAFSGRTYGRSESGFPPCDQG